MEVNDENTTVNSPNETYSITGEGLEAYQRLVTGLAVIKMGDPACQAAIDSWSAAFTAEEDLGGPPEGYDLADAERDIRLVSKSLPLDQLAVPQADTSPGILQPAQGNSLFRVVQNPVTGKFDLVQGHPGIVLGTFESADIANEVRNLLAKSGTESVGLFLRIPPEIAKDLPATRGDDESPLHATVLQMGEIGRADYEKLILAVGDALKQVQPCRVELSDKGVFRSFSGSDVEYLVPRMCGDGHSFEAMHDMLIKALEQAGFRPKRMTPFKPHVTLRYNEPGTPVNLDDGEGGSFTMNSLEVWGESGGEFERTVIELGSGKVLRRVSSSKTESDLAVPQDVMVKREISVIKVDSEEERTVFGIVLEPETIDSQNDIYNEDEIRKTAYRFLERYQQFGLMHQDIIQSILPLESYLAPVTFDMRGQSVKKGTWLLRVRVLDDRIWEDVKSGRLTGFSIGGSALRTPDTVQVT